MTVIASIMEEISQIKPVSNVAGRVMTLMDNPESGMADLAEVIQYEPALTANVLKLANSAYFGLPGKIEDAKQAIVFLGMTQVVELVLLVCCSEPFHGSHAGYELSQGELWKSAVSAAIMANDLSEIKGLKQAALPFTGALLRDVGKVVTDRHVQSKKEEILSLVKAQSVTFMVAERQVLGFDHTQAGAIIAEKWHFPADLQCILKYCHSPLEAKGCFLEAAIVNLADYLCRKMGIGLGVDDPYYPEDARVSRSLGLSEVEIQEVVDNYGEKMDRVKALFEAG
jgi:HD-like signal output (HDOD) protein